MAGKAPRPNKNSDGQKKGASQNPQGGAAAAPPLQGPPSLVPPGGPPSIQDLMAQQAAQGQPAPPLDPNIAAQAGASGQDAQQQALLAAQQHMQTMQQGQQQQQAAAQQHAQALQLQTSQQAHEQQMAQLKPAPGGGGAGPAQSSPAPAPQAPPGADQGIAPSQWKNNQVREGINFKDLPPMGQAQAQEQEGINPAAPLQMIQSQLQSSMTEPGGVQGGPQQGPMPASFSGPMVPPGLEGLPHDLAQLTQVMQRGLAPGADNAEHQMGLNAHAMAKASVLAAQNNAAQGAQQTGVHQAIGGLLQHLQMAGQLPHPADVADTMRRHAGAPQLTSSY